MDRPTKLFVIAGALALLAAHLAIGRAWSGTPEAALLALVAGGALAWRDRRTVALVLAVTCLVPPLVWLSLDVLAAEFWTIWMAALLGAMLPDLLATPWHAPLRWRVPLLLSALVAIVGTLLVVWREIDFNPALLGDVPGAVLSGLPWHTASWTLHVGLASLTGILWFDWVLGTDVDLDRFVLRPLVLSLAASALVAAYQMFVDVTFLNETVYGSLGRAGGTMFDANVAGMLSAVGIGLACALAHGPRRQSAWLLLVPLFALSVWASGSRTGAGATAIVLAVSGATLWREPVVPSVPRRRVAWAAGVLAVVAIVVVVAGPGQTTTAGPVGRFVRMLPGHGPRTSARDAIAQLWRRNGYGTAAVSLIGRFPWTGIGTGSFHSFGPRLTPVGALPPDNAQNWLRHQIAELGWIGASGWLAFAAAFAWFLARTWRRGDARLRHLKGVVLAFAAVSLVGLPTQEMAAAVVFWTAAAMVGRTAEAHGRWQPLTPVAVGAVVLVVAAFGVGTWRLAHSTLRVPVRAREIGWPYAYGFYAPEPDPAGGTVRWMGRRATALVDVTGPFMRLSIRSPLPNVEKDPVDIEAWCEGRRVIRARVTSGDPVTAVVPVPAGLGQTVLDVRVSRTVRPRDLDGTADDRDLGALVSWTFGDRP